MLGGISIVVPGDDLTVEEGEVQEEEKWVVGLRVIYR